MKPGRVAQHIALGCLALMGPSAAAAPDPLQPKPSPVELWAENALTKVLRSAKADASRAATLHLSGARREWVSGQAVFCPQQPVAEARATLTALKHRGSDAILPASATT